LKKSISVRKILNLSTQQIKIISVIIQNLLFTKLGIGLQRISEKLVQGRLNFLKRLYSLGRKQKLFYSTINKDSAMNYFRPKSIDLAAFKPRPKTNQNNRHSK